MINDPRKIRAKKQNKTRDLQKTALFVFKILQKRRVETLSVITDALSYLPPPGQGSCQ